MVGIIGPWNYPLDLMVPPIVSALLAGNTVLVKPSEVAAATGVPVRSGPSRPEPQRLDFEDTEMPDSRPQGLSGTQYGDL